MLGATWRLAPDHVSPNPLLETITSGSDSIDPAADNDSATVSTAVAYIADLGVTKTDGLPQVSAGMRSPPA